MTGLVHHSFTGLMPRKPTCLIARPAFPVGLVKIPRRCGGHPRLHHDSLSDAKIRLAGHIAMKWLSINHAFNGGPRYGRRAVSISCGTSQEQPAEREELNLEFRE